MGSIHTIAKAADENLSRTDCMDVFGAIALSGAKLQHAFMLGRGGQVHKGLRGAAEGDGRGA